MRIRFAPTCTCGCLRRGSTASYAPRKCGIYDADWPRTCMSVTGIPVCIVEDDEDIRTTLRFLLEDAGYSIREAANGVVALELLRSASSPMVVLLDLMLPILDGAGVLAR